jgi:hypothetical protein
MLPAAVAAMLHGGGGWPVAGRTEENRTTGRAYRDQGGVKTVLKTMQA